MKHLENLKGTDKVLYRMAYEFEMKYAAGATEETAHEAGLKEIARIKKLSEETANEKWIDITTGKEVKYGGW